MLVLRSFIYQKTHKGQNSFVGIWHPTGFDQYMNPGTADTRVVEEDREFHP